MDLKREFIRRLNSGERMADLCREYGIARKTGHKLQKRCAELGEAGLEELSRSPKHIPHRTPPELVELIVAERLSHPSWGPKKLKDVLEKRLGHALPAPSTIGGVLARHGLVEGAKRRARYRPRPTLLRSALAPNEVWCTDYKGQFRLGDGSYCYPLTTTDRFSRYILCCEGMAAIDELEAQDSFVECFRKHGLPLVIRSDNGVPFASSGLAGLTKLSVYWLRLGITLERIRPGHPEENGQHERMHRTLKRETTRPSRRNLLQQQERFDDFVAEFNDQRPHEALGMKRPSDLFAPSARPLPTTMPEPSYPTHDDVVWVNQRGQIGLPRRKQVYLGTALANQPVGIREQDDGRWLVSFMDIDLGHVEQGRTFRPLANPPGISEVLPMFPV
jgi:transposase InsO family protein